MFIRPTSTAIALAIALPAFAQMAFAQSTATISTDPAAPCAATVDGGSTDKSCLPAQNGGLGSKIKPVAGSDHDSEDEGEEADED